MEKRTCSKNDRYLIDEKELVWYPPDKSKPVLAVPRSVIPELLAIVHTLHGHAGVGATLSLVCGHFHWPAIALRTCRKTMENPRSQYSVHRNHFPGRQQVRTFGSRPGFEVDVRISLTLRGNYGGSGDPRQPMFDFRGL